jgi:acetyl-CoA carboxylase carboxyl transferase subunit alpha
LANLTVIDFEKSIAELDLFLEKLRQISLDPQNPQNTPELAEQIAKLEHDRRAILQGVFSNLTPWDKVLLARHERRPYTLDYIGAITDGFQELHGDRLFADDGAIVAGIGWITVETPAHTNGSKPRAAQPPSRMRVAIVGHQKGRDIKTRQMRNFGYARPEGYRKASRVMRLAAKFGLPIITLVDTPGAAADVAADERGVSEAIAMSMFEMATLRVPIVTVVIGEGGSGGALAIAVADRVLMLEHATYSVIAPEGCAAILWRDPEKKADAAQALNLTAQRAKELGIVDDIVPEPLGGAHRDWAEAAEYLRIAVGKQLAALHGLSGDELVAARYDRFRNLGQFTE